MSKELKAFEQIKKYLVNLHFHFLEEELDIIEKALKRLDKIETTTHSVLREDISEKLKAFEIIKEKYVIPTFIANSESVEEYNRQLKQITFKKDYEIRKLTQKEYDIVKEVLS